MRIFLYSNEGLRGASILETPLQCGIILREIPRKRINLEPIDSGVAKLKEQQIPAKKTRLVFLYPNPSTNHAKTSSKKLPIFGVVFWGTIQGG